MKEHVRKAMPSFQCPNSQPTMIQKTCTHLHEPIEPLNFDVILNFTSVFNILEQGLAKEKYTIFLIFFSPVPKVTVSYSR